MPSYNHDVDIDPVDLSEAPRLAKETYPRGTVIGVILCAGLFLGMLVYGSLPELSPSEIVAMEGYAGERPTKHIFNLQSLEDADKTLTVEKQTGQTTLEGNELPKVSAPQVSQKTAKTNEVEIAVVSAPQTEKAETENSTVLVEKTPVEVKPAIDPQPEAVASKTTVVEEPAKVEAVVESVPEPVKSVEPAIQVAKSDVAIRVFAENAEQKVVAAQASTPAVRELPTTIVTSALVAEPSPMPMPIKTNEYKHAELARGPAIASVATTDEKGRLLPLRTVLKDFTEVKSSPSSKSPTLLSLGKGVVVTAFEKQGEWVHIGTNDGSSITGYVLESEIAKMNR